MGWLGQCVEPWIRFPVCHGIRAEADHVWLQLAKQIAPLCKAEAVEVGRLLPFPDYCLQLV